MLGAHSPFACKLKGDDCIIALLRFQFVSNSTVFDPSFGDGQNITLVVYAYSPLSRGVVRMYGWLYFGCYVVVI